MSNTITITGHLGSDAELRYTPSGVACLDFSVCDEIRRKNDSGDREAVNKTWWRCHLWRDKAEAAAPVLTKGVKVIVSGRAKLREYETRDGEKGRSLEVDVYDVAVAPKGEPKGEPRQASQPADDGWGKPPASDPTDPPF